MLNYHFLQTQSIAEPSTYESFLDGLRGIAILMILFFHTSLMVPAQNYHYFTMFPEKVEHLSRGVHLFFIMSALTLFQSFYKRMSTEKNPFLTFMIRRGFRILPLWWFALTLYFFYYKPSHVFSDVVANAFFYFGFLKEAWTISVIPGGWSLFVEESFYLFFPIWVITLKNFYQAIIAVVISYLVAWLWYNWNYKLMNGLSSTFVATFPLGNYFAFFIGIALFFLRKDFLLSSTQEKISFSLRLLLDLLAIGGLILLFYYDRMVGSLALVPMIIASFFPSTLFGNITRHPLIVKFGTCCYSIYLLHSLIANTGLVYNLQRIFFEYLHVINAPQEVQTFLWFFPFAGLSLLGGIISFKIIERPFVQVGKKLIQKMN